jgi:hypothetical protein
MPNTKMLYQYPHDSFELCFMLLGMGASWYIMLDWGPC